MIEKIFFNLSVLFGVIIIAICHDKALNSNELEAKMFLKQTSDEIFNFYEEIGNQSFIEERNSQLRKLSQMYTTFFTKLSEEVRKFDFKNFKDKELKHAFESLVILANLKIIEEKDERATVKINSEANLINIIEYLDPHYLIAHYPEAEERIEETYDLKELQYYWTEWRKSTGKLAERVLMDDTIETLKKEAELTEKTPLEFWTSFAFNISDMEILMTNIQPLYMEIHAFVRNQLRQNIAESNITSDGLIPKHLLLRLDLADIDVDYPSYNIDTLNASELYKIADKFFESLGFEVYPSSFWVDQVKTFWWDCRNSVWEWSQFKHLDICDPSGHFDFLKAYNHMSKLYYAKEMEGLPAYFFTYPKSLDRGISKAVELSATTLHNLNANKLLPDDFNITQQAEMNRLFQMVINYILYLPNDFVHAKVMADLLSGKVQKAEVNNHYWQLMAKYAGIGPPKDHKIDTYDLPQNFYSEMASNKMSIDFIKEFLGYQIHKKLCELSGNYPKEPLHLCDIYGSKDAGDALKKMMQLGASKPFNEVLASMFPENPKIMAEDLLEYYSPVRKFLTDKNKEANVKPGWKSSDKK